MDIELDNEIIAILVFVVSLVVSILMYPRMLRFAISHDIVDNPNARKLQRRPVPVMGGFVVYTGILAGGLVLQAFMNEPLVAWGMTGMSVMLIIGMWDDIKSLSASLRFLLEIILILLFMWQSGIYIDDLHGLWGVHEIGPLVSYPLNVVAGVGIINAVNLIDGVDGYSSGFGMLACLCFAILFMSVWSQFMVCLAMIVAGALLPFFMHNVFGVRSKMFIGDGGTLMLGMLMVVFVFYSLSSKGRCASLEEANIGLEALAVAIVSIPVFDTTRVMIMRILRGNSPFKPDKTHLHHLFIDMGFSHLGAAASILIMNLMVIMAWLLSWQFGASIDIQSYVVLVMSLLVTFGFYKLMKVQKNHGPVDEEGYPQGTWLWHAFCHLGAMSHREKGRAWQFLRWLVDTRHLSKKVSLILLLCLPMTASAQQTPREQRQVRVTMMKGSVFEGALLEFKAFDYLILDVKGQKIKIDYKDMAYIDDIQQAKPAPSKAEPVKKPKKARKAKAVKKTEEKPIIKIVEKVVEKPVVKPAEPVEKPVAKPIVVPKLSGNKGFLLESGNNVYLECVSNPKNEAYNEAALDVLRRQMRRDGFWKMVDRPEDAQFSIVCLANLGEKPIATIGIHSLVTGNNHVFGEIRKFEDVDDYRRVVWELYNKYVVPLQKKIESNKIPKNILKDFTK